MANTFQFAGGGSTYTFLIVATAEGIPLTNPRLVEEVLEAAGVNGRRWRTLNRQHPVLQVRTLAEAATLSAARALADDYLASRIASQTGTLVIDAAGTTFTLANCHVGSIEPVPRIGQPVGPLAGGSSLAHVLALWNLELTAF